MSDWYVKAVPADPNRRRALIVAAGLGVAVVVIAGSLLSAGAPESHVTDVAADITVEQRSATIFVHVAGRVVTPGIYELPVDSRVFDAIAAAGGLTDNADGTSVNLARTVEDGEQIVVTEAGQTGAGVTGGKLNINRATVADFDRLPRIGPTLAERIVAYRDENGPFATLDELGNVPGIGELTLAGFRDQITL